MGWGVYNYSPPNVPSGLSNVTAIAGFGFQQLALRADGSVVTWPVGPDGHMEVLAEAETAMGVAVGANHRIALKNDGTVIGWGDEAYKTTSPAGLSNVTAVASGANHNLALKTDGTVAAWGQTFDGQSTVPIGLSNVVRIAGGGKHSLALGLNAPPRANPQSVAGGFNQDTVITLSGVDINADPMVFRHHRPADGGRALSVCNQRSRSADYIAGIIEVTDLLGRVIFVPATNGFGRPYASFGFTASDGEAVSSPGLVTVVVVGPTSAATLPPGPGGWTGATLRAMVVPGALPGEVWFEWGTNSTYGHTTSPVSVEGGSSVATSQPRSTTFPQSRQTSFIVAPS